MKFSFVKDNNFRYLTFKIKNGKDYITMMYKEYIHNSYKCFICDKTYMLYVNQEHYYNDNDPHKVFLLDEKEFDNMLYSYSGYKLVSFRVIVMHAEKVSTGEYEYDEIR